jgi:uncharacterized protein YaaR (DUF327 family)
MENHNSSASQGLGIAGLVLGILSIPLAIIPCTFWIAIFFGIIGIVLASIGLNVANREGGNKGLIIAALVCSLTGTIIAGAWVMLFKAGIEGKMDGFEKRFEQKFEEHFDQSMNEVSKELEKTLEELENADDKIHIDWNDGDTLSKEEFEDFITTYEAIIQQYIEVANESQNNRSKVAPKASILALKATSIFARFVQYSNKFTEEQKTQIEQVNDRYEEIIEEMHSEPGLNEKKADSVLRELF